MTLLTIPRLQRMTLKRSCFLFGPRGTGKTTLLRHLFPVDQCQWIDLLQNDAFAALQQNPDTLIEWVQALAPGITHVVIDEVQRVPLLLNTVHHLIENTDKHVVLTASSARTLKRGGANLLAGRAFVYHLYPLTALELGPLFSLDQHLRWGGLPGLLSLESDHERVAFLSAYANTYLQEEIWSEHVVRDLAPFSQFLHVAAQSNGTQLNFLKLARDVGIDDKSIASYYQILEDTLLGFFLPGFTKGPRQNLGRKAKFYFFDLGVARALGRELQIPLHPKTYEYGRLFEQWVVVETQRLNHYHALDFTLSHLRSHDGHEIDLIIERPGRPTLLVEIKSAERITQEHLKPLKKERKHWHETECICVSQEPIPRQVDGITILPWRSYFQKLLDL